MIMIIIDRLKLGILDNTPANQIIVMFVSLYIYFMQSEWHICMNGNPRDPLRSALGDIFRDTMACLSYLVANNVLQLTKTCGHSK